MGRACQEVISSTGQKVNFSKVCVHTTVDHLKEKLSQ